MASAPVAVLYRPKLCQASLGEILHGVLHPVYCVDCSVLLLYGLDGECMRKMILSLLSLTVCGLLVSQAISCEFMGISNVACQ